MKLKNSIYFLLILFACKDGGDLVSIPDRGSLAWSFNQVLAANNFSSGSSTRFSSTSGFQFVSPNQSTSFAIVSNIVGCFPQASSISINNSNIAFEPAKCGITKVTFYSNENVYTEKDYYFISATRTYDLKQEFISFLIEGSSPKSGTYQVDFYNNNLNPIFFSYDIYTRNANGSIKDYVSYYPLNGTISTDASNGFRISTNFLQLKQYNNSNVIQMKFSLSCCK